MSVGGGCLKPAGRLRKTNLSFKMGTEQRWQDSAKKRYRQATTMVNRFSIPESYLYLGMRAIKLFSPFDSVISVFGIYPKEITQKKKVICSRCSFRGYLN